MSAQPAHLVEHSLRLFVDSVKDYAIFMLDPEGRVQTWNRGAQRIKGYSADQIVGEHFSRFYPPEDLEDGKPQRELDVARRDGSVQDEGWRLRSDGSRFWAHVTITAVRDEAGRLAGFGKVTRDMSDLRARSDDNERLTAMVRSHAEELEEQVRRRTSELERSNRDLASLNEALQTFAYSMSHDLRGPLRTIQGFAEILLTDYGASLDAEAQDYLTRIAAASTRLSQLVENLLAYARLTRSDARHPTERVSLDRALDTVLLELQAEGVKVKQAVSVERPLGDVLGHRDVLMLIMRNLLLNALKFVRPDVPARVAVASTRAGDRLTFSVQDNGIGVAEQDRQRIFEPFERLHSNATYAGTGLGLAIVVRGVTRLGGTYGVTSDGQSGSTFWVELPAPRPGYL